MSESNPNDPGVKSESDMIYRAPEADTSVAPDSDDLYAAYVGPSKAHYYGRRFMRFESEGGMISWNWPAFFVSAFWFLWRKMWLNALLYWFGLPFVLGMIAGIVGATASDPLSAALYVTGFYYGGYLVVGFILVPMFANYIYLRHVRGKVDRVSARYSSDEQRAAELARIGGTSKVVVIVIPIVLIALVGILAAISIPAYQDYTIRAQVSEGLSISAGVKAAAAEQFEESGSMSGDNTTLGLARASEIRGAYVSSVDYSDGTITVTYGNQAHAIIAGETLELTMTADPSPTWHCRSETIAPKHLPAACR